MTSYRRRPGSLLMGVLAVFSFGAILQIASNYFVLVQPSSAETSAHASGAYAGAEVCKACHAAEFEAWTRSHHALAMQEATDATVLGNFGDVSFSSHGAASRFFKRDGLFMVHTAGSDGVPADFVIRYTFGVFPLQQYLIEFPGGRYQALSIAWDSRPKSEGGQRWFDLNANEAIAPTDPLHWTRRYQSWNLQCAACHSTDLRKNYDAISDSYSTRFSELNVACEACHGPGSRHVEWARSGNVSEDEDTKALAAYIRSRWDDAWSFPSADARFAVRDAAPPSTVMNACWPCHARRSTLREDGPVDAPLLDSYRPVLLAPPLYFSDGQQREESYIWGSFTQSKMYARGVTCMDCHEPHGLQLRAEGNALCGRCHNPSAFDVKEHHHHEPGSKGAECTACHMPERNYMIVDARADHSLRLPRPDLTTSIGTPNACNSCHSEKSADWAAAALDGWFGEAWRDRSNHGVALNAGLAEGRKGLPGLLALAQDGTQPAVVRATAATIAHGHQGQQALDAAGALLADQEPIVRLAALGLIEPLEQPARLRLLSPLLADPVRAVRAETARILADVPVIAFAPEQAAVFIRALSEYEASLRLDADWPASVVALGNLRLRQGKTEDAIAAFERAIKLDPHFSTAYVSLSDAYRQTGRDSEGGRVLRQGLAVRPQVAELHHALGFLLVRLGDRDTGVEELEAAARLAPENPSYSYAYAIGLNSTGRAAQALSVLNEANRRNRFNIDILSALVSINRDAGNWQAALAAARELGEALPDDPGVAQLISELSQP
jgi:predicted CXXCH cytochrome family protein